MNALRWTKLGHLFDPSQVAGKTWMNAYAQAPSAVVLDNGVRVFFSSRPAPDPQGQYVSRLAYIDLDSSNLFKIRHVCEAPVLELGGLGTFDEFGTYPASVIRTNGEMRVYYAGWTRCETVPFNAAIGVAVSRNDGLSFQRLGSGPVLSYSLDEPFVLGSPKIRKFGDTWYLWYSAGIRWIPHDPRPEPVYKIRMARSDDGLHWTKVGRDLLGSTLEETECQASADVFFQDGKYHMLYCYRNALNFRDSGRGYRIGYASSMDLLNWSRDDRLAGIEKSDSGWDSESVSYPHVFTVDNTVYLFYQGNEIGRYGFGLARLDSSPLERL